MGVALPLGGVRTLPLACDPVKQWVPPRLHLTVSIVFLEPKCDLITLACTPSGRCSLLSLGGGLTPSLLSGLALRPLPASGALACGPGPSSSPGSSQPPAWCFGFQVSFLPRSLP